MKQIKQIISMIFVPLLILGILSFSQSVDAYAEGEAPYIMVSSYEVSNGKIVPGEQFEFKVTVKNVDTVYTVSNVVVTVDTMDGINAIYPSVPQQFVGSIGPQEERTVTFSFKMVASYDLDTASFYTTLYSNANSSSIILSVPVEYDDEAFDILSQNIPTEAVAGEKISASLYFRLHSDANMSNVSVRAFIDENEVVNSIIGNLRQGASKTQNLTFSVAEIGKHTLLIEIEGTDSNGVVQVTEAYRGSINITKPVEKEIEEVDNTVVNMRSKRDYWVMGGSLSLILLSIVGIVFVIKKNKR